MDSTVLVAIVTAGIGLVGTIITVLAANRSTLAAMSEQSKVTDENIKGQIKLIESKITTLSERVDKHNNAVERTYNLEARVKVLEEVGKKHE